MTLVVDASVVIKWLLQDPAREAGTKYATALMNVVTNAGAEVLQPFHWLAEILAVLSRLSPGTAAADILRIQALELPTTDDPSVLKRACQLATEHRTHAFDTLYHAVALGVPDGILITADTAYHRVARSAGRILLLDEWWNEEFP